LRGRFLFGKLGSVRAVPVSRLTTFLVVFAAAAFYLPSISNPLVWDDPVHLDRARAASASVTTAVDGEYLRPLVSKSFELQIATGTDSVAGLHAFNVILHALNAWLLIVLARRFGAPGAVAAAGAAVFALHPLQSGAVAYISGRTDILAFLFVLLALHGACTAAIATAPDASGATKAKGAVGALLALVAVVAATLSKESGVVAGPLVAATAWFHARSADKDGTRFPRALTGFAAVAVLLALGALVWVLPPAFADGASVSVGTRLAGAGTVLESFARLLVRPVDLHLDRLEALAGPHADTVGAALLAVMAAVVAVFVRWPARLSMAAVATVLCYAPTAGYIPVYPLIAQEWVFVGEHLLYAVLGPLALFVFGAATGAFYRHGVSRYGDRIAYASILVLAVVSAYPVYARQAVFADAEGLYKATLAHSPSSRACFNLGVFYIENGRYEDARATYEKCLELSPNDARMHAQLGVTYQKIGKRNLAEVSYARALEFDADDPRIWSNYASLDATWGYFDDAREKWLHALELDPDFAPAREGLKKLAIVERQRSQRAGGRSQ
jgi:predicted TPR repeat methyltransferase